MAFNFATKGRYNGRRSQAHYARFLLNMVFGVVLAFPLGIITASLEAVSLFGTIIPISIFLAVVLPVVIPLIAIFGVLLASWRIANFGLHTLITVKRTMAALTKDDAFPSQVICILLHAYEVAYMGIYGMLVVFNIRPLATEREVTSVSLFPSSRRQSRIPLFIHDLPMPAIPALPLTPSYSDPSYTPSRSPTCTESTDTSFSLRTPIDEPAHSSATLLSQFLDDLKDEELSAVASYVEILKIERSSSTVE